LWVLLGVLDEMWCRRCSAALYGAGLRIGVIGALCGWWRWLIMRRKEPPVAVLAVVQIGAWVSFGLTKWAHGTMVRRCRFHIMARGRVTSAACGRHRAGGAVDPDGAVYAVGRALLSMAAMALQVRS